MTLCAGVGDINLFGTPVLPHALDHVILAARIAAAAGDAGGRAAVLRAVEKLQREEPTPPLFTAVAEYARGILESDAQTVVTATELLRSSSRPLLYAAAAEDAARLLVIAGRTDEALDHFNAAFDTYARFEALADARRVGRELRGWASNGGSSPGRGQKRAGTALPTPSSRSSTSSSRVRPIEPLRSNCTSLCTRLKTTCTTHLANSASVRGQSWHS